MSTDENTKREYRELQQRERAEHYVKGASALARAAMRWALSPTKLSLPVKGGPSPTRGKAYRPRDPAKRARRRMVRASRRANR